MPDSTLTLRLQDVHGQPLGERADVLLRHQVSGRLTKAGFKATAARIAIPDLPFGTYAVQVHAPSYRAVSVFAEVGAAAQPPVILTCPVDPARVASVAFPAFADLSPDGRRVLDKSDHVLTFEGVTGEALYDRLDDIRRAGFLNILAKCGAVVFADGRAVAGFLQELRELRGDRFFAVVPHELREEAKNGVHTGLFHPVPSSLHHPPLGFADAGSFKTADHYGNLQLTFFSNGQDWVADIDIDDAQGVEHVFQVVRNEVSRQTTNPYDIHELLIAYQKLDPGYRLNV